MGIARVIAAAAWVTAATGAHAQTLPAAAPQNVLQLTASGTVEVQQDLLTMSLATTREGADAAAVQTQLKVALDAALTEARGAVQPGQLEVRTGHFGLSPRYTRDGKISGWSGSAELVLEGRDFARIARTAARIQTLTVGGVSFALSREQRARVEREAQGFAIDSFKAKAADLAKGFGFSSYSLREVSVSSNDQGMIPRPRMMAAPMAAGAVESSVPIEAGKSAVVVTVSGSVQLR